MKWYERLKQTREARGLKKSHFAKLIGVAAPTITEWERGDTENPSAKNTLKICEVLHIKPEWLMYGDEGKIENQSDSERILQIKRATELLKELDESTLAHVLAIIETFSVVKAA